MPLTVMLISASWRIKALYTQASSDSDILSILCRYAVKSVSCQKALAKLNKHFLVHDHKEDHKKGVTTCCERFVPMRTECGTCGPFLPRI